ncbi:apolipoprotein N-acyltransferase [Roseateles asaccharophilus]|uniref:Apolipoprotein N-acyltransferase n=1 Tax=Roseateles asaccharophilus TaxID=582607 RepID=A0ABU2A6X2_9BURK|nr:apolipoprotein N-acyltransferase [Roseateles asaccharophilus]MDR7332948.1 apolipoprotein N-acyltransferase [Roseateles asaccharophilus]
MRPAIAAAVALGAGLLQTASFAPTDAWWAQILALALLFGVVQRATPKVAALCGALFGFSWLASGLWWLHISMHQFGHIPSPLAALAVGLLAAFLCSYYALALGLTARFIAPGRWRLLALVPAWLLAELARATWFSGFPWIASGYAHTVGPLVGWAPWIGVYGIIALAALAAAGLVLLKERAWTWGLPAVLLPLAGLLLPQDFTTSTGRVALSLVQPSIPQDQKFDAQRFATNLGTLAGLIDSARGQVVITPESVVPLPLVDLDPATLQHLSRPDRPALLGVFLGNADEGFVNSVIALGSDYHYGKRHLLPFGEFIPPGLGWFVRAMNIPLDDQARGQHQRAWSVAGQRLRPLICYEDLFGEDIVQSAVGADAATVFVNVSNLAWFGTVMVQDQHLQFSQMRALEFQRPVVRSTNTGATAAVDHRGHVTARMPSLERGVLEVTAEGRTGTTPYARWLAAMGLWPLWLAGAATLLLLAMGQRRHAPKAA